MNLQAWCDQTKDYVKEQTTEHGVVTISVLIDNPNFRFLYSLDDYNVDQRYMKGSSCIVRLRPKPKKDALAIKHKKPKLDIGSVGAIFGRRLLGRSGRRRG